VSRCPSCRRLSRREELVEFMAKAWLALEVYLYLAGRVRSRRFLRRLRRRDHADARTFGYPMGAFDDG
jgi:hypothetical protein